MKQFAVSILALTLAACATTQAPRTAMITSTKSVAVNAAPAKVWGIAKDFDGLDNWHPAFSLVVNTKGGNGQVGAVRALTLKDGPTFTEELLAYSDSGMSFKYKIIESPLPLDNYVSQFTVAPNGNGSTVTWTGSYTNKSDSGKTDADVKGLIDGAYQAGLDNLKKMAEAQ